MKKVIVTGANGFIGSSLIQKLIEQNIEVCAIDKNFTPYHLPNHAFVTHKELDLTTIETLGTQLPKGYYDTFYHLAWQGVNGADKADPTIQLQNVQITMRCATIAKALGCHKFLCAGTVAEQAVYSLGNLSRTSGGMIYGIAKHCTHLMLETYCKNIGLDFVWMQFSNIYGPKNKTGNLVSYTLGELAAGKEATFGPAGQPYDFIFVDDLIEAVYRIGECQNRHNYYYIGSGAPRILKDYLLEIGELYGRKDLIRIGHRPDDGIVYTVDMFATDALLADIGPYVTKPFTEGITYTIANY